MTAAQIAAMDSETRTEYLRILSARVKANRETRQAVAAMFQPETQEAKDARIAAMVAELSQEYARRFGK